MKDLIKALQILHKYVNTEIELNPFLILGEGDKNPNGYEHHRLYVDCGIKSGKITDEDIRELNELGLFWYEQNGEFISFRFGNC